MYNYVSQFSKAFSAASNVGMRTNLLCKPTMVQKGVGVQKKRNIKCWIVKGDRRKQWPPKAVDAQNNIYKGEVLLR